MPRSAAAQALLDSVETWSDDDEIVEAPYMSREQLRANGLRPGRPRVVPEDAVRFSISAAPETIARLDAVASKKGMSRSALIRQLIENVKA